MLKSKEKKATIIDRRRQPRILFETFGFLDKKDGTKPTECYLSNIGLGGAKVLITSTCSIGDNIILTFQVGEKKFEKKGIVKMYRPMSDLRKTILKVGKRLEFQATININFFENLEKSDYEYIRLNYLQS